MVVSGGVGLEVVHFLLHLRFWLMEVLLISLVLVVSGRVLVVSVGVLVLIPFHEVKLVALYVGCATLKTMCVLLE